MLSFNRLGLSHWLLCAHSYLTLEPTVHSVDGNSGAGGSSGATPTQGPTLSGLFAGGFPVLRPVGQRDKDSHNHPGAPSSPDPLLNHLKINLHVLFKLNVSTDVNSNENDLQHVLDSLEISLYYSGYFHIVLTQQ